MLRLGNDDEGFIHRVRMRLLGHDFKDIKCPCNNGKWNIRESIISYCLDINLYKTLFFFDIDEWCWRLVPEIQPKVMKTIDVKKQQYWNPHLHKYMWLGNFLPDTPGISMHSTTVGLISKHNEEPNVSVKSLGKIPVVPLLVDTRKRRTRRACDDRYDKMVRFIAPNLCNQQELTQLKLKDTNLSVEGFKTLGDALPATITDLNVSCHLSGHEYDAFFPILWNGKHLERLNMGYCGILSFKESMALSALLLGQRLKVLNMEFTYPDCNWYTAIQMSNITFLSTSDTDLLLHDNSALHFDEASSTAFDLEMHSTAGSYRFQMYRSFDEDMPAVKLLLKEVEDFRTAFDNVQAEDATTDDNVQPGDATTDDCNTPEQEELAYVKQSKRDKVLERYAKRNAKRNQLIDCDRMCKFCGTVWPKGSIKLQTFEGIQSMCKLSTRKCQHHAHYGRVFRSK